MTPDETQWIKTPLEDSINWKDFPPDTKGRVILKKWPADTKSAEGIVLPGQENRRVIGVAWVYRAFGDAGVILCPGDSVLVPSYSMESGLRFPAGSGVKDLEDFREVDAANVYHVLPYAEAVAWREKAAAAVLAEIDDALPKISLLGDEDNCGQALAWLGKLRAKAEPVCKDAVMENLQAEVDSILLMEKVHLARKAREAVEAEEKDKADLAAERQRLADKRNQ